MIRMTRLAFLGVFILAMCVFFPIVGWPAALFWLALIPIAAIVWILRTQTTVSPNGLDLRSVFSSRHIDWEQLKGVSIPKRGYVRAHLDDDTEVPLPAVSYDRLRDLVDASGGRIPDPFALPDPDAAPESGTDTASADEDPRDTGKARNTGPGDDSRSPDAGDDSPNPPAADSGNDSSATN
ncbi:PH domain-containing protein [Nocardia flavorosea]|nr:PH domain-containing protein [Nocardia flavorosea]